VQSTLVLAGKGKCCEYSVLGRVPDDGKVLRAEAFHFAPIGPRGPLGARTGEEADCATVNASKQSIAVPLDLVKIPVAVRRNGRTTQ
jgi:hypothetical protein